MDSVTAYRKPERTLLANPSIHDDFRLFLLSVIQTASILLSWPLNICNYLAKVMESLGFGFFFMALKFPMNPLTSRQLE